MKGTGGGGGGGGWGGGGGGRGEGWRIGRDAQDASSRAISERLKLFPYGTSFSILCSNYLNFLHKFINLLTISTISGFTT